MRRVYLSGPITGLSYGDAAEGWRAAFTKMLPAGLQALSPMRGKEALEGYTELSSVCYPDLVIASPAGIVARDRNDVMTCDAVVCVLTGAKRVSIGTMIELGWADAFRKPIILVMEKAIVSKIDGVVKQANIHEHAFVSQLAAYRVETLEEAAILLAHLLPGV